MTTLKNKVAIITGASSGFGRGTALAFAKQGCNLVLNSFDEDGLQKVVQECQKLGVQVYSYAGDAGAEETDKATVQLAIDKFGRIDILDNNVGIGEIKTLINTTATDFDKIMRTNVRSAFLFTKYTVPHMIKQHDGQIIMTSSITGTIGQAGEAVYTTSKFALRGFGQALEQELLPLGICTTVFRPHAGSTNFEVGHGRTKEGVAKSPFLTPEDVGVAMVNICTQPKNCRVVELKLASKQTMWPVLMRQDIPNDYPDMPNKLF